MSLPSPSDYQEALQLPDLAFGDPLLAQGAVSTSALGLPRALTGAFAVVFQVETAVGPKAVRCFLHEQGRRAQRFERVRAALEAANLPYFVAFAWHEKGIHVDDRWHPILVMDWVEGIALDRYVAAHHTDAERLRALYDAWVGMLADLATAQIAHGDLQHGNVLVREAESGGVHLTLVDYDAVQDLRGRAMGALEVGHRHYQHPDRTVEDSGLAVDLFPGLVVATALAGLCAASSLWERYATGENLLFRADDFYEPDASPLFSELLQSEDEHVCRLAGALHAACLRPPGATPTIPEALAGEFSDVPSGPRARSHKPELPSRRTRTTRRVVQVGTVAAAACAVATWWIPFALGVSLGILIVTAGTVALGCYRSPYRRRRLRIQRELARIERWAADLDAEAQRMRAHLALAVVDREAQRQARLVELQQSALHRHLRQHFVGELDALDGVGHRAVVRLKAAGIRDAAMATPDAISAVSRMSGPTKVRIGQWRSTLARRYAEQVPEVLPPAEEHRLRRRVERVRSETEGDIRRIETKANAQRAETAALYARLSSIPSTSFVDYLRYLLRP